MFSELTRSVMHNIYQFQYIICFVPAQCWFQQVLILDCFCLMGFHWVLHDIHMYSFYHADISDLLLLGIYNIFQIYPHVKKSTTVNYHTTILGIFYNFSGSSSINWCYWVSQVLIIKKTKIWTQQPSYFLRKENPCQASLFSLIYLIL